jgi:hypothetical protein
LIVDVPAPQLFAGPEPITTTADYTAAAPGADSDGCTFHATRA